MEHTMPQPLHRLVIGALLFIVFTTAGSRGASPDVLSQVSTIDALLAGLYDGVLPLAELKRLGNFGLGTFDRLDGEMVVLDGTCFQIRADGKVFTVADSVATPFAAVTFFEADQTLWLDSSLDLPAVESLIDRQLPTGNIFYGIRITGRFHSVKTRSVPAQTRPYPPLTAVVNSQPVFVSKDVRGTLVGLRCPAFVKGINVPGYHLHFLSDDRSFGGHVLEATVASAAIAIDHTTEYRLILPQDSAFYRVRLDADRSSQLQKVEK
jgi:acetolactate decarboxylase